MTRNGSYERIRDEIARDLTPVTPIRPGWQTALVVLPLGLFLLSVVLLVLGLREDAPVIGAWPLWGPPSLLIGAAYGILVLALVQRAPESTTSWVWWAILPLVALGIQIGGAYWTLHYSGGLVVAEWQMEARCFLGISLLGVPTLLLVLWLLSRGLPLRPKIAGLLSGLAGGLLTEGIYRLHCSMPPHPRHIVPWHTGAILMIGVLGLLAGLWWERQRARSFAAR